MTRPRTILLFRIGMLAFAALLAMQAIWALPAEFARTNVRTLPTDADLAAAAFPQHRAAYWAAWWGGIRADLWAESAFTFAGLLWTDPAQTAEGNNLLMRARTSVDRALSEGPHRSGVWLLRAALASRFQWSDVNPGSALKMSYYTGPGELALTPMRLKFATHSNTVEDAEIEQFVRRDVRMILNQRPELKPVLVETYREASAQAKRLIEQVVREVDPSFLSSLDVNPPPAKN